jgi:hypothetical protein
MIQIGSGRMLWGLLVIHCDDNIFCSLDDPAPVGAGLIAVPRDEKKNSPALLH